MIKMHFDSEFIKRFEGFLSSNLFIQPMDAKSSYWTDYTKKISVKIKNSSIFIEGKAGNYIPPKKYSTRFFFEIVEPFLKKIFYSSKPGRMSWEDAFNKIMNENDIPAYQQIKFDDKKIIAKNISECKKIFPFKYAINKHYIRSYYFINILCSYIDLTKTKFIAEIGAGSGNLLSLLKYHFSPKSIINIDLPETLTLSIPFLKNLFPDSKILLPNEINQKINYEILQNYDFVFLTPNQIKDLEENLVDLFINTGSFQEMHMSQIEKYLNAIQKVAKKDSFFFNSNRVEKVPYDGKKNEDYSKIKPTRFSEYPFFKNDILLIEICRFSNLTQDHPLYTRLEKIIK